MRTYLTAAILATLTMSLCRTAGAATLDETIAPGRNYDKAEFRLWYVNVSQGSGQAFLDALTAFAGRAKHPELQTAPLLLWGMSAGGEFNYEFVNWKPERVIAFVVNKGGIYYTALTSPAARSVPGVLLIGGKDLDSRIQTITGLFASASPGRGARS